MPATGGLCFLRVLFIRMVTALFRSAEIYTGIVYAMMIDACKDQIEALGDLPQVFEREIAHAELIVQKDTGNNAVGETLDTLG